MKTFKDLQFKVSYCLWNDIENSEAIISFNNGYSVKVCKHICKSNHSSSLQAYAMIGEEFINVLNIKKNAYRITEDDITEFMIKIQQLKPTTMEKIKSIQNKKKLERLNPNKPVRFDYQVYDCEHDGDMSYAEMKCQDFCEEFKGKVVFTYWDGEDCGEAYITCEFPADKVEDVLCTEFFERDFYQL